MFSKNTYKKRRNKLIQSFDSGILLFLGNQESSMNFKDNVYPFRQDSSFLYYFGINRPDLNAVIDVDSGKSILFGDDLSLDYIVWMGNQPTMQDFCDQSDIEQHLPAKHIFDFIKTAQTKNRDIHFLPPYRPENQIFLKALTGISFAEQKEKASVQLIKAIVAMRSIKTNEEIVEMEKAVNLSVDMHEAVIKAAREGIMESELTGIAAGLAMRNDSTTSYPIILSKDGHILHNHYHGNMIHKGDLILADMGAEVKSGYAGDLTRTFPAGQEFTQQQKEIYEIVLQAEIQSINELMPGKKYKDVHLNASSIITSGLKALGLMKGDTEEAVMAGAHALFFPHGLGHQIGLDVHDMEDLGENYVGYDEETKRSTQFGLRSLRFGKALTKRNVITVEPGIYFIPALIEQWKAKKLHADFINYDKLKPYMNFGGIRIEDNVLIEKIGYRVLGRPLAKSVEDINMLQSKIII